MNSKTNWSRRLRVSSSFSACHDRQQRGAGADAADRRVGRQHAEETTQRERGAQPGRGQGAASLLDHVAPGRAAEECRGDPDRQERHVRRERNQQARQRPGQAGQQ